MSPPRGASCAWCSIAGRICCCRATSIDQDGTPLTFNKVLVGEAGISIRQPARSPRRSSVGARLESHAALRRERASDDGAHAIDHLVSLTAYRSLDYEFFVDADITELDLMTTHQHERQHQLSEEITISHQQPRLTWVGGVFLFDESDHQTYLGRSAGGTIPGSARPARRRDQPRGLRTGDGRIDVRGSRPPPAFATRTRGRTSTTPADAMASMLRIRRFPVRSTAIPIPSRTAPGRPKSASR